MITVEIYGWRPGLEKISHTNLLQKFAGMGLKQAHDSTHALLDGVILAFEAPDQLAAEAMVAEFTAIGANARVVSKP